MERTQKIEEALSIVWEEREKNICGSEEIKKAIAQKIGEDMLEALLKDDHVVIENDSVRLTPKGEGKAKDIIRRQRLAERLLIDVLELGRKEMDCSACELEHILSKEVEESICTLLGHPRQCPHGLPIPSGDCCAKANGLLESIVVPLSKLGPGESGKLVYVLSKQHSQLHKLMSFGVVPGVSVYVHQTFPTYIIKVEETELALEKDIAKEIYVKRLRAK